MKLLPLFPTKSETAERCQFHQHFMSSLFRMKAFCASFLYLKFVFVFLLAKGNGKEAACKMLVELTKGRQKIKIDWKFGRHKKQRKSYLFCLRNRIRLNQCCLKFGLQAFSRAVFPNLFLFAAPLLSIADIWQHP